MGGGIRSQSFSGSVPLGCDFIRVSLFFIGVKSLYKTVLISAVQCSEPTTCIHISLPSCLPTPPGHHRALS